MIIRQFDPSTDAGMLEFEEHRTIVHIGRVAMVPLFSKEAFLRKFGTNVFYLAFEAKKAVGAVLLAAEHEESSHLALVYGIKVDESWRCQGIGLQLMQQPSPSPRDLAWQDCPGNSARQRASLGSFPEVRLCHRQ